MEGPGRPGRRVHHGGPPEGGRGDPRGPVTGGETRGRLPPVGATEQQVVLPACRRRGSGHGGSPSVPDDVVLDPGLAPAGHLGGGPGQGGSVRAVRPWT